MMWSLSLAILGSLLACVSFYSLFERKLMASVQLRLGPDKVVVKGLAQPVSDGVKLLSKQEEAPYRSEMGLYLITPSLTLYVPMLMWVLIPSQWVVVEWSEGFVVMLILFSVSVYGLLVMGWSSNSKYASLGIVRAVCQSISYEVGLTLTICAMAVAVGSFSLSKCAQIQSWVWMAYPFVGLFMVGLICGVAEADRTPFDLPESESVSQSVSRWVWWL